MTMTRRLSHPATSGSAQRTTTVRCCAALPCRPPTPAGPPAHCRCSGCRWDAAPRALLCSAAEPAGGRALQVRRRRRRMTRRTMRTTSEGGQGLSQALAKALAAAWGAELAQQQHGSRCCGLAGGHRARGRRPLGRGRGEGEGGQRLPVCACGRRRPAVARRPGLPPPPACMLRGMHPGAGAAARPGGEGRPPLPLPLFSCVYGCALPWCVLGRAAGGGHRPPPPCAVCHSPPTLMMMDVS
jgi:hypothetical protein